MSTRSKPQLFALFIFILLSWGIGWPVNKIGLNYMSPVWFTAARLVIGTITMMLLVIMLDQFRWPKLRDIPLILVIGLLQISVYMLLANIGLSYLPPGRSAIIAYTTPLWVMPIATWFFKERADFWRWSGFFLGIAGLIILISPWEMNWHDINVIIGTLMLLAGSFSWAISMLCVRYMKWTKAPLELIPWQLLIGAIPMVIYAWIKEPMLTIAFHPTLVLTLVYTGVLVTGISYWTGVVVNKELPTTLVSLGFLFVPVISLLVSAVFLHEMINLATATAMTMILLGMGFLGRQPASN